MIETYPLNFTTKGENDIVDITPRIAALLKESKVQNGMILVFVTGSTAALSTIEYEPGLIHDIPDLMDRLIPKKHSYRHDETWHDGNGHSHLRATLLGPSLSIPIQNREMTLGQWQQIVLFEFDLHSRNRQVILQIIGI